ncbi:c-type cytochrome [Flavobacterium sp. MAH-1]|uniref:C-type cytochrome n=1 Tax=Flavobacterium agri TaxID=2743471 RepID=A0A7Y9C5C4_9FLAO|nr:c-type cytochrome [Flavobacterium agri]NUY80209.1 c-type cytochrome [Flavobacterium agri]NYA70234.1 c-type cytochrome [Flavobacterium agri]
MKTISTFLLLGLLFSCATKEAPTEDSFEYEEKQTPVELGEKLFNGKGNCYSCHNPEQKIIGPSLLEIGKIYKDKNGNIVEFLKEKADPIVDPAQYPAMKVNFAITKRMSDEELKALEAYIYSFSK